MFDHMPDIYIKFKNGKNIFIDIFFAFFSVIKDGEWMSESQL